MIRQLPQNEVDKHSYRVKRPFKYKGVFYKANCPIEASGEDLKFLIKNSLIIS